MSLAFGQILILVDLYYGNVGLFDSVGYLGEAKLIAS